ncbi:MAG: class I tRNA ligase family protein, partial [Lapillicoccus sp.]
FATVVRAHLEHDSLPWANATINGWILDPDRKKMSKSKGNATTPIGMLVEHGTDAVRYWAASARLGTDAALDTAQMKVGRRLASKGLNASRFALSFGEVAEVAAAPDAGEPAGVADRIPGALRAAVSEPLDRAMLATLADVVDEATAAFEAMDYTRALEVTETFFWTLCDDYLGLFKDRAYGGRHGEVSQTAADSARAALRIALEVLLRLLAPVVVFATEEVWSWFQEGSIHRAPWPVARELRSVAGEAEPELLTWVGEALSAVRKVKSEAKVGMRAEVASIVLAGPAAALAQVRAAEHDLRAAGRISVLDYAHADALEVRDAVLLPPAQSPP